MQRPILGIFLIAFGLLLLVQRTQVLSGDYFLIILGLALIASYFVTVQHRTGLLVAGSILIAIGAYSNLPIRLNADYLFFLSLGMAFAFVVIAEKIVGRTTIWPLYPAFALAFVSIIIYAAQHGLASAIIPYWPVVLILAGAIVLLSARR